MSHLKKIAQIITAMVSSVGACERVWRTYSWIHDKRRNSLSAERTNDLVYVYTNKKLIEKFGKAEKFADWVGGESDVE